uniref:polysaccharide pyruvyl transferase family protein n=1 Tax=Ningiella ruwaisensis TaxID=2364274 RepID=UPI00109FCA54|nr:polysaccharide pyruvyl transferase family protein [Ningiella ruwaisensis]
MTKLLHLASFTGNIGDNASHMGLYDMIKPFFSSLEISQLEMRKFYQKYQGVDKMHFDESFIEAINKADFAVIGGGGFLDYWHKNSQSGTTIDIAPNLIRHIKTPTFISSMGAMALHPVPDGNKEKAQVFFEALYDNENIHVAVRNDGSLHSISRDLGPDYLKGITEILDHGFFYAPKSVDNPLGLVKYVALNITEDQLSMQRSASSALSLQEYHLQLKASIEYIVHKKNLKVVLVPHIYSDLRAINALLNELDDWFVRQHLAIAPCIQGDSGADYLFNVYRSAELVIGMRFHANVCSLSMAKKCIGLVALDRIEYLYESLGINDSCVSIVGGFAEQLKGMIDKKLRDDNGSNLEQLEARKLQTINYYKNHFCKLLLD